MLKTRTRTHWKCLIGYFLADKMKATTQTQLMALQKASDVGLRVWSITADGINSQWQMPLNSLTYQ